ncbi:MAG: hypothetical protein HYW22_00495 [Candidatus Aenigmarchaeota archaeon]|nr:hypothetical protein [Candidatus Aenigmarchaeota archaeon]
MSNGYLTSGFGRGIVLAAALLSACSSSPASPASESPKLNVTVTPVTRYAEGQVLKLNRLVVSSNGINECATLLNKYGRSFGSVVKDNGGKILARYPARVFDQDGPKGLHDYTNSLAKDGMSFVRESNETEETLKQLATELYQKICEDPEKK